MDAFKRIVAAGGPNTEEECKYLSDLLNALYEQRSVHDKSTIMNMLKTSFSADTMQGFALRKPRGYAGDFEIIDRIYTEYECSDLNYRNWDVFFHKQSAPKAVRNRKDYFKSLMLRLEKNMIDMDSFGVLNIGSGPCRDVMEYYDENPGSKALIDCVDMDVDAIEYAKSLCVKHLSKLNFEKCKINCRTGTQKLLAIAWISWRTQLRQRMRTRSIVLVA